MKERQDIYHLPHLSLSAIIQRPLNMTPKGWHGSRVDYGVRVVGVNPGGILTERQIDHMQDRAEKQLGDRGHWKEILAKISETLA